DSYRGNDAEGRRAGWRSRRSSALRRMCRPAKGAERGGGPPESSMRDRHRRRASAYPLLPHLLAMLAAAKHNSRGMFISRTSNRCTVGIIMMLALAGCSALQPDPRIAAEQKESMLSAAGFRMLPAQTPDKLAHAQSLPQLKLKYYADPDGTLHYWMADA